MNRRYFFQQLASGLVAAVAPSLFLPKIIKPGWKSAACSTARQGYIDMAAEGSEVSIAWSVQINDQVALSDLGTMSAEEFHGVVGGWRSKSLAATPSDPGYTRRVYTFGPNSIECSIS